MGESAWKKFHIKILQKIRKFECKTWASDDREVYFWTTPREEMLFVKYVAVHKSWMILWMYCVRFGLVFDLSLRNLRGQHKMVPSPNLMLIRREFSAYFDFMNIWIVRCIFMYAQKQRNIWPNTMKLSILFGWFGTVRVTLFRVEQKKTLPNSVTHVPSGLMG